MTEQKATYTTADGRLDRLARDVFPERGGSLAARPALGLATDAELAEEARLTVDAAIADAERRESLWAPVLRTARAMGLSDHAIIDEMCRVVQVGQR